MIKKLLYFIAITCLNTLTQSLNHQDKIPPVNQRSFRAFNEAINYIGIVNVPTVSSYLYNDEQLYHKPARKPCKKVILKIKLLLALKDLLDNKCEKDDKKSYLVKNPVELNDTVKKNEEDDAPTETVGNVIEKDDIKSYLEKNHVEMHEPVDRNEENDASTETVENINEKVNHKIEDPFHENPNLIKKTPVAKEEVETALTKPENEEDVSHTSKVATDYEANLVKVIGPEQRNDANEVDEETTVESTTENHEPVKKTNDKANKIN